MGGRPLPAGLLDGLRQAVGPGQVLTAPADLAAYARDSWTLTALRLRHGLPVSLPDAVALPGDTSEVSAVLRLLDEAGVPVIPFGGGSGVLGGTVPVTGGVVVDTKRLDRVLEVNGEALTVTAQAGILGVDLERTLARAGYTLGHFPQSIDCSTLGGWIATRSSGQFSTKYGNIEDLLLAVEAVLPGGLIMRTKRSARSSTGPDVKNLFAGSEGTLGIVTEACLRVCPAPEKRETAAYELDSFGDGLEAVRRLMRTGLRPAVIRLYDPLESLRNFGERVTQGKCALVFVFEGLARLVDLEVEVAAEVLADFPHRDLGPEPGRHWLAHRNDVSGLPKFMSQGLVVDTLEVAATWDRLPALYRAVTERMSAATGVVSVSVHSSHAYTQGANLYVTFLAFGPDAVAAESVYRNAWAAAMRACLEAGGTISHHHGVGLQRVPWMPAEHGPALEVLRRLKAALDPKGLLNPGKLLERAGRLPAAEELPEEPQGGGETGWVDGDAPARSAEASSFCALCPNMCRFLCPVAAVEKVETVTPRGKATVARLAGGALAPDAGSAEVFYRCAGCRVCREWCPAKVDLAGELRELRTRAAREGLAPQPARALRDRLFRDRSLRRPAGELAGRPGRYREMLTPGARVLYFAGCSTATLHPEVVVSTLRLFEAARVEATMFDPEECCGLPLDALGYREEAAGFARSLAEAVVRLRATTVVSGCPMCVYAMSKRYPVLGVGLGEAAGVEVKHVSEFLDGLAGEGRLGGPDGGSEPIPAGARPGRPPGSAGQVTYHDPCHLGRHLGIYDAPRRLLTGVAGLDLVEMEQTRELAACCGGPPAFDAVFPETAGRIGERRTAEARRTGAGTLVTACPHCLDMLAGAGEPGLPVRDIAEVLAERLGVR